MYRTSLYLMFFSYKILCTSFTDLIFLKRIFISFIFKLFTNGIRTKWLPILIGYVMIKCEDLLSHGVQFSSHFCEGSWKIGSKVVRVYKSLLYTPVYGCRTYQKYDEHLLLTSNWCLPYKQNKSVKRIRVF